MHQQKTMLSFFDKELRKWETHEKKLLDSFSKPNTSFLPADIFQLYVNNRRGFIDSIFRNTVRSDLYQ